MQRTLAVRLSGDGVPLPVPAARPGVSMQLGPPGPSGLNTAEARSLTARRRSAAVDELQRAFPSVRALNTERCVVARRCPCSNFVAGPILMRGLPLRVQLSAGSAT